jgi:hypothetical protein
MLDDPVLGLHIGTWVWHELADFVQGAVVLAMASTLYDLRDYETFKREMAQRQ